MQQEKLIKPNISFISEIHVSITSSIIHSGYAEETEPTVGLRLKGSKYYHLRTWVLSFQE